MSELEPLTEPPPEGEGDDRAAAHEHPPSVSADELQDAGELADPDDE